MKFITPVAVTLMASTLVFSSAALAAPPLDVTSNATSSAPSIQDALKDFNLPSQVEIDGMLEDMPDFNAILGDVMVVMKDEKLRARLQSSAETFKDKIEESDVLTERDANGLPDIKALMSVMLGVISDEGVSGELLEGVAELAGEMEAIAEKHDLKSPSKTRP